MARERGSPLRPRVLRAVTHQYQLHPVRLVCLFVCFWSSTAEELSLRYAPLSVEGQHLIGLVRSNVMDAVKRHDDYRSPDEDTTTAKASRPKRRKAAIAKPLDIFVQLALGARVLLDADLVKRDNLPLRLP